MGHSPKSTCQAQIAKSGPNAVVAKVVGGQCTGDHLAVYQASDSAYSSQTMFGTPALAGTPVNLPCGYWQADYYSGWVASKLPDPGPHPSHVLYAWLRGNDQNSKCGVPTTTTTTTTPSSTTTNTTTTTTNTTSTTTGGGPGRHGKTAGSHGKSTGKDAPATAAAKSGAATAAVAHPASSGALAFTGAAVGPEAGFGIGVALMGAMLVRVAHRRRPAGTVARWLPRVERRR